MTLILILLLTVLFEFDRLKVSKSKYVLKKLDIQLDIQIYNDSANSNTANNVVTLRSLGRSFSSVNHQLDINSGSKHLIPGWLYDRIGEFKLKGSNRPKASSRSLQPTGL